MTAISPFLEQLDEVLVGWERSWANAAGQNILLTGGTGFVGTWMLELFCRANCRFRLGAQATVLTRDPEAFAVRVPHLAQDPAVTLIHGDVRDFEGGGRPFSWTVHGATSSNGPFARANPMAHLETIVQGTRRVLDVSLQAGVKRFLYLSSGAVYGPQPVELQRIDETHPGGPDPMDPGSLYAQGKRMAEHLCAQAWRLQGLECMAGRGFAFVGPGLPLDAHFAIGNFIRDLVEGKTIEVCGDGTPFRSYLYASEMALAFWLLLLNGKAGHAYNVGSDQAIQIGDLARLVAQQAGGEVRIREVAEPGRRPSRYVPSIDKMRHEFGFNPRINLTEAIRRTIRWCQTVASSSNPSLATPRSRA